MRRARHRRSVGGMTREIDPIGLDDDAMWRAVEARDRRCDGRFFFGVRTTGIYCRPSCPARRPHRANVSFHATPDGAEMAGYRACLRCRPREAPLADKLAERMVAACRAIEEQDEGMTLDAIASRIGMSRYHFQRTFKMIIGVSPKSYVRAVRGRGIRERLQQTATVTGAIHEAGYAANSRYYAEAAEILGMTTREYRTGGEALDIRYAFASSSLGEVLIASTDVGVCAILIGDDRETLQADLARRFPRATLSDAGNAMARTVAEVVRLIDEPATARDIPLDIRGTAFQQRVWQALRSISPGATATYAEIARQIGAESATRAVAGACAANPLAVAVPCHRVVRSDGGLSGYRWGVERKRALLEREVEQSIAAKPTKPLKRT